MGKKEKKARDLVEEAAVVYGQAFSGKTPESVDRVVGRIRAGLPFSEFDALRDLMELSGEELAERVGISRSTLARRKITGRLDKDQSDKVVRFARIFATAKMTFDDDQAAALRWLKAPQRALEYSTPLDFSDTEAGAREVERLLGRIEHSVYS